MKHRLVLAVKCAAFILTTCICVAAVNEWLMPKYLYNDTWPSTNTFKEFYGLKKDSVDVLFFGSSHAICAFNPQVIYDRYGITSYNLGTEQQSLVMSYYWLREALKTQSPKAVILETCTLHKYTDYYVYNDLNCDEASVRKAMDCMKLSPLKAEAAYTIEKIDPTQSAMSFLLPNIRYHSRWTDLDEKDYKERSMISHGAVKGCTVLRYTLPGAEDMTFNAEDADNVEPEPMIGIADEYLGKIRQLCNDNGIRFILVNIPYGESIERYRSTRDYAEKYNIPYYDFNEYSLYHEIGYTGPEIIYGHTNYTGAEKISTFIGDKLLNEYGIAPREDASYDQSRAMYEHLLENYRLIATDNIYDYLDMLGGNDNYSIFIFGPNNYIACFNDDIQQKLYALGFRTDLRSIPGGSHYLAVKDAGSVTEQDSMNDFRYSGAIRGGLTMYSCIIDTTLMVEDAHVYSLMIDGEECGKMLPGLDIVVYDNDLKMVIDKVNCDTTSEELPMKRYN